jgi:hypothetical protein
LLRSAFGHKIWHTIFFSSKSELQNIPEAAPETSRSFSVSEKLARYGSSALSGVEHLTLLVGKKSVALALIRHFGSLKGLARVAEIQAGTETKEREAPPVSLGPLSSQPGF